MPFITIRMFLLMPPNDSAEFKQGQELLKNYEKKKKIYLFLKANNEIYVKI